MEVRLATVADRRALQRMLELYQYELSDIWDQDLNASGEFSYALDRYWSVTGNYAYVALVDGHYAGFALVDDQVKLPGGEYWMDQFFVMKKYRRNGVGCELAATVIHLHPGQWQVGQMTANHAARTFWHKALQAISTESFDEFTVTEGWWQGFIQKFASATTNPS